MTFKEQLEDLRAADTDSEGATGQLEILSGFTVEVVRRSIQWVEGGAVMIAREEGLRHLLVVEFDGSGLAGQFAGNGFQTDSGLDICFGDLNHENAVVLRLIYENAWPQPLGLDDSFGLGDRLGIAGPAHLRSLRGTGFKVVLAQQSIRELERTERTPDEVMDAAIWAVLEEGWSEPWGADADHLKTPEDVELMAAAGFTMFTIDPGDHVVDAADTMSSEELREAAADLPWSELEDSFGAALRRYSGDLVPPGGGLELDPSNEDILRGWVKYGPSLAHTAKMYRHIATTMGQRPFEVEVSVDETASVTTPFEHWLVASELRRLGVEWIGLAPRFVGDFEKGIDYRGDLEIFRTEYLRHLAVA